MKLVLLGPPGAGKGTLAGALKERLSIPHISTGDILREEMKNNTELGQEAKKYVESGKLVPDALVTKLIEARLSKDKVDQGYMLDGFPRTKIQAEDLDNILKKIGKPVDYAIYMKATLPVIIQRLTGRRVCRACGALFHMTNNPSKKDGICDSCGGELYQRSDDNEETIKTRMDVYLNNTTPIIEYYKNYEKLMEVDADKEAKEVVEIVMRMLNG